MGQSTRWREMHGEGGELHGTVVSLLFHGDVRLD